MLNNIGRSTAPLLPLVGPPRQRTTGGQRGRVNWLWWMVRVMLIGSVLMTLGGIFAMVFWHGIDDGYAEAQPMKVSLARGRPVDAERQRSGRATTSAQAAGNKLELIEKKTSTSSEVKQSPKGDWLSEWAERHKRKQAQHDDSNGVKEWKPQSPCPYFDSISSTSLTVQWRFSEQGGPRWCQLIYKQVSHSRRTESRRLEGYEQHAQITGLIPTTEYEFILTCRMASNASSTPDPGGMQTHNNMQPCRRRIITRGETNLVANPSFEENGPQLYEKYYDESYRIRDPNSFPAHWQSMMTPIDICKDRVRSGESSLCLKAPDKVNYKYAATQFVFLNSSALRSEHDRGEDSAAEEEKEYLLLSAWSTAKEVSGKRDGGYSMLMQIHYADGTHSYGHKLTWRTEDHRWERECLIVETPTSSAILSVSLFILFLDHSGTVWFDDIHLAYASSASSSIFKGDYERCDREEATPVQHGCCPHRFTFPSILSPPDPMGVSIVTQLTIDRLPSLRMMAQNWDGPISAAIYAIDEAQLDEVLYFRSTWDKLANHIDLHIVVSESNYAYKTLGLYPVNTLRNIALTRCRTHFAIVLDADFIPSPGSFGIISNMLPKLKQTNTSAHAPGRAWVIPAFEIEPGVPLPESKHELVQMTQQGLTRQVHEAKWAPAHGPTNYPRWMESSSVYEIEFKPEYEPYMMVERDTVPLYDERFIGYGYDKVSHTKELHVAGYRFFVLPEVFATHFDHGVPRWRGKGDVMRSRVFQNFYAFMGEVDLAYKLWPPRANTRKWQPVHQYRDDQNLDSIRYLFKPT